MHIPQEQEVLGKLVGWGTVHPLMRAMPNGVVDMLSDYDLILVVSDVGCALGYNYPQLVDEQVSVFLKAMRELPPPR